MFSAAAEEGQHPGVERVRRADALWDKSSAASWSVRGQHHASSTANVRLTISSKMYIGALEWAARCQPGARGGESRGTHGLKCSSDMMSESAMRDLPLPESALCSRERGKMGAPLPSGQLSQTRLPDGAEPNLDLEALGDVHALGRHELGEVAW